MNNRKMRKGRVLICLMAALMILMLTGGIFEVEARADITATDLKLVYVHEGDTLWSIVEENCAYSGDIRAAIHEVKSINHMHSSEITEGEVIYVPVN